MDESNGSIEHRTVYCPVHHIKCQELKDARDEGKLKLPIWVGKIFIVCLVLVLGYMNLDGYRRDDKAFELLNKHVKASTIVLKSLTHAINEVAINQQRVMEELDLEFKEIPYDGQDN